METDMLYEQVDTSLIDGESLPWVPFAPYAENVLLKYFKLDPIRGEWIVLMKSPIDMQLPKHHHTGTVMVYTIEGKWKYKEHDWIAGLWCKLGRRARNRPCFGDLSELKEPPSKSRAKWYL
jgi:hypothetical protein